MAKKSYTLIVVPDHDSPVKRYHIQQELPVPGRRWALALLAVLAPWGDVPLLPGGAGRLGEPHPPRREPHAARRSSSRSASGSSTSAPRWIGWSASIRSCARSRCSRIRSATWPWARPRPSPARRCPAADTQFTQLATTETPQGALRQAGQALRRGHPAGAEPPGAAGLLPGPEVAARLHPVHLAGARLGDLRLRPAARPVHRRARDARRPGHRRARTARKCIAPSDGTVVFAGPRGRLRQRARDRPRLRHQDPLRPPVAADGEGRASR